MTEEKFEAAMEHFGDVIDKSMNRAWKRRPIRFIGKTISFLTGVGLMASAVPLAEKGNGIAAKFCLISGIAVILAGIVELFIFRKK